MLNQLRILISLAFLGIAAESTAQYKVDYGIHLGAANYLGEIGGKEGSGRAFIQDMKMSQSRPAGGIYYRYKINHMFSVKANALYGRIKGADSISTNPQRVARNASFRNTIMEVSIQGEFNFYTINDVGGFGTHRLDFRAYAFAGFCGFYHNPQTFYNNEWVDLQPLATEGTYYSKYSYGIPAGLGCYYTIQRMWRIGLEAGGRKTFTDYLDDLSDKYVDPSQLSSPVAIAVANRNDELKNVENLPDRTNYTAGSPRGNPKNKDSYFFSTITVAKVLRGKSNFYKSKYNFITGAKKKKRKVRAKF